MADELMDDFGILDVAGHIEDHAYEKVAQFLLLSTG